MFYIFTVWDEPSTYIMLGLFVLISSGISVYWSYYKIIGMKNIKANIPFGLDLYTDNLKKKTSDQLTVPAISVSNERLNVIFDAESLDTASYQSSNMELINSSQEGSIQSQDSSVTAVVKDEVIHDEVIQDDPPSGVRINIPSTGVIFDCFILQKK